MRYIGSTSTPTFHCIQLDKDKIAVLMGDRLGITLKCNLILKPFHTKPLYNIAVLIVVCLVLGVKFVRARPHSIT